MTSSSCLRLLSRLLDLSIFHSIKCFTKQFVRKMWPVRLAFLRLTACRTFHSSMTLYNILHFFTWSDQLTFSILHQHHIVQISRIPDRSDWFQSSYSAELFDKVQFWGLLCFLRYQNDAASMDISTLEDEAIQLRQNLRQVETTSYHRRTESSAIPLWRPQKSCPRRAFWTLNFVERKDDDEQWTGNFAN